MNANGLQVGLVVALSFVAGCVGNSVDTRQSVRFPSQKMRVEDPAKARIVVMRGEDGLKWNSLVKDGPKRIGSIYEEGYLCWEREPGPLMLSAYMDDRGDTLKMQVESGRVYYVKHRVIRHWVQPVSPKLQLLSEKQGRALRKKCEPPIANARLARPIKGNGTAGLDLGRYEVATVVPFANAAKEANNSTIGTEFADEIHELLKNTFGPAFREVRFGAPTGAADELVITGTILKYNAGNRDARMLMAGLGAASFKANLVLKDAASEKVLLSESVDKLWAWGGIIGARKGVQDMFSQSAVAAAATVAQGKGWKPNRR
jgi:Domain of unknown function (DUF4410)